MRHEIISVSNNTNGNIKTYLLDDGEYERKGLVRPAVVICPGGGYTCVSANEGEPVAMFFNRHGYHAFVLDYSVKIENPFPTALKELATAMAYIRNHKAEWNISSVYVIGFSAGGNLALSLGVYGTSDMLTKEMGFTTEQIMPDKLILGYPAVTLHPVREEGGCPPEIEELMEKGLIPDFRGPSIREILLGHENPTEEEKESLNLLPKIHKDMPPTFVWGGYEDSLILPTDLTGLAVRLYEMGVPCELHLFGHGPHGMSLCDETVKNREDIQGLSMHYWTDLCLAWLKQE